MFESDLLISFALMALLFLRQISILKQPHKINYAPLIVGVGIIGALIHFIIHPETMDTLAVLRESFIPILVSLLLYIIMNILHQTSRMELLKRESESSKIVQEQITDLQEIIADLQKKMILNQAQEKEAQEQNRERFKHDIKALDSILINQNKFLEKFEELQKWHNEVKVSFENFTEVQLPSLDNVVHKHIDILRVAEQDHFNKVKATLVKAIQSRNDIADEIEELKEHLYAMSEVSTTIANTITQEVTQKIASIVRPFEKELRSLETHTQGINTSLYESENKLDGIKERSEMIMKQMILSSEKMGELQKQNSSLYDIYTTMRELIRDIEIVKSEYVKSQSQLSIIFKEFQGSRDDDIESIKQQVQSLSQMLIEKLDDSLEKLHEHYHAASEDISQSVQFLSKKAQLKTGYSDSQGKYNK